MRNRLAGFALALLPMFSFACPALAQGIVEPRLAIRAGHAPPQVALTLDLCMGRIDRRIFDVLIREKIPATLFVTRRWLAANRTAVAQIRARPELFEIGNHGADHIPAVDTAARVYGLKTAGNLYRACQEVAGGDAAIHEAGLGAHYSGWYRGAAALYSPDVMEMIEKRGLRIAGFSLNADMGASLPAATVARRIGRAKDGDVIIAHMNQPLRQAGAGVARGIMELKQKGFRFVRLSEGVAPPGMKTTVPHKACAEFLKDQSRP